MFVSTNKKEYVISSLSAVLMEAKTGAVIYEHMPNEQMSTGTLNKVMTMLLIAGGN